MNPRTDFGAAVYQALNDSGTMLLELPDRFYFAVAKHCDETIPEMRAMQSACLLGDDIEFLGYFGALRFKPRASAVTTAINRATRHLQDIYLVDEDTAHATALALAKAIARIYDIKVFLPEPTPVTPAARRRPNRARLAQVPEVYQVSPSPVALPVQESSDRASLDALTTSASATGQLPRQRNASSPTPTPPSETAELIALLRTDSPSVPRMKSSEATPASSGRRSARRRAHEATKPSETQRDTPTHATRASSTVAAAKKDTEPEAVAPDASPDTRQTVSSEAQQDVAYAASSDPKQVDASGATLNTRQATALDVLQNAEQNTTTDTEQAATSDALPVVAPSTTPDKKPKVATSDPSPDAQQADTSSFSTNAHHPTAPDARRSDTSERVLHKASVASAPKPIASVSSRTKSRHRAEKGPYAVEPTPKRRNPLPFAVAAAVIVVVMGAALWGLIQRPASKTGTVNSTPAESGEAANDNATGDIVKESPIHVAFSDLLSSADTIDYSCGWDTDGPNANNATHYSYTLIEMTGDDVPELMIGANSTSGSRYLIYQYKPITNTVKQVLFHPVTWVNDLDSGDKVVYGRPAEGHGLVRYSTFADGNELYELITITEGEETYEVHDNLVYTSLDLHESTDRSGLDTL